MELSSVLRKVRALIEKAEHPETPVTEAKLAGEMADALMLKYAIDQANLDASRPADERMKPGKIEVPLSGGYALSGYITILAEEVARHCRCRIRSYGTYSMETHEWVAKVYGYDGDLRYFELLYTTLRLHMVGALRPSIDPAKSIEDNAYALHNAGRNWWDIAQLYGWKEVPRRDGEPRLMYERGENDGVTRVGWGKAVAQYKRAYLRACEARGEKPVHVPPAGSATFRRSAADGYVTRLSQRLRAIRDGQQIGSALALRTEDVDKMFREDNPELFKVYEAPPPSTKPARKVRQRKYVPPAFNQNAYEVGTRHANTASINPAASNNPKKGIS